MQKTGKSDLSVELLRIIACLFVVGVHCKPSFIVGETELDLDRLYIASLFADGVAIFWVISGFFLFRKADYGRVLKRAFRTAVVPVLLLSFLFLFFGDFLMGRTSSLAESVSHTPQEYGSFFALLLSWAPPLQDISHLWYLFDYAFIMLLFPALRGFASFLDESVRRQCIFMGVSFAMMVLGDYFGFMSLWKSPVLFIGVYLLWGHILYQHRLLFRRWYVAPLAVVFYLAINLLRVFIRTLDFPHMPSADEILMWYSSIALLVTVAMTAGCLSIRIPNNIVGRVIGFLGSHTLGIYLAHFPIIVAFGQRGYTTAVGSYWAQFWGKDSGSPFDFSFQLSMMAIIFLLSLLLCVVCRCVKKAGIALWRCVRPRPVAPATLD